MPTGIGGTLQLGCRSSLTTTYREEIRAYADELAERYPEASACRKRTIGGYTVNLARAGALLANRLTAVSGQLLIVLPSTIFADQVSSNFRHRFFSDTAVQEINVYPAEARLFSGVDQSFVTINARGGKPNVKRICTLALARSLHPEIDSHTLGALAYFYLTAKSHVLQQLPQRPLGEWVAQA